MVGDRSLEDVHGAGPADVIVDRAKDAAGLDGDHPRAGLPPFRGPRSRRSGRPSPRAPPRHRLYRVPPVRRSTCYSSRDRVRYQGGSGSVTLGPCRAVGPAYASPAATADDRDRTCRSRSGWEIRTSFEPWSAGSGFGGGPTGRRRRRCGHGSRGSSSRATHSSSRRAIPAATIAPPRQPPKRGPDGLWVRVASWASRSRRASSPDRRPTGAPRYEGSATCRSVSCRLPAVVVADGGPQKSTPHPEGREVDCDERRDDGADDEDRVIQNLSYNLLIASYRLRVSPLARNLSSALKWLSRWKPSNPTTTPSTSTRRSISSIRSVSTTARKSKSWEQPPKRWIGCTTTASSTTKSWRDGCPRPCCVASITPGPRCGSWPTRRTTSGAGPGHRRRGRPGPARPRGGPARPRVRQLQLDHRHVGDPIDDALANLSEPIVREIAGGRPGAATGMRRRYLSVGLRQARTGRRR